MPYRTHLLLTLIWVTPLALAQDQATRVEREANNPLRMIIEASKLKPRAKATEAEPAAKPAAETGVARAASGRPAAPVAAAPAARAPKSEPAVSLALAETGEWPPGDAMKVEPALPRASGEGLPAAGVTAVQAPAAPAALSAEGVPTSEPVADAAPMPASEPARTAAATRPVDAAPLPLTPLQLADYVEPTLPDRVRRRLQADGEVVVDFTIHPDGSVADAAVRSSSDRALDPIAIEAVRQWRYRPIAAAQAHAVQLVFRLRE